jgi:hypothetical protein
MVFAFELKLLAELGQQPDLATASLTTGSRRIVEQLTSADWPAIARIKLSAAQSAELGRYLHGFLAFHVGRIPGNRARAL